MNMCTRPRGYSNQPPSFVKIGCTPPSSQSPTAGVGVLTSLSWNLMLSTTLCQRALMVMFSECSDQSPNWWFSQRQHLLLSSPSCVCCASPTASCCGYRCCCPAVFVAGWSTAALADPFCPPFRSSPFFFRHTASVTLDETVLAHIGNN